MIVSCARRRLLQGPCCCAKINIRKHWSRGFLRKFPIKLAYCQKCIADFNCDAGFTRAPSCKCSREIFTLNKASSSSRNAYHLRRGSLLRERLPPLSYRGNRTSLNKAQ
jgi:hypothetical protein